MASSLKNLNDYRRYFNANPHMKEALYSWETFGVAFPKSTLALYKALYMRYPHLFKDLYRNYTDPESLQSQKKQTPSFDTPASLDDLRSRIANATIDDYYHLIPNGDKVREFDTRIDEALDNTIEVEISGAHYLIEPKSIDKESPHYLETVNLIEAGQIDDILDEVILLVYDIPPGSMNTEILYQLLDTDPDLNRIELTTIITEFDHYGDVVEEVVTLKATNSAEDRTIKNHYLADGKAYNAILHYKLRHFMRGG